MQAGKGTPMSQFERNLQTTLGVAVDGIAGRGTFTALFRKCGASPARATEFAITANVHFRTYGVLDSALRLAHFMAQLMHESMSFRYMEEIWGPTPAQRGYEGRKDLGNTQPGDGYLMRGRGPLQCTGRSNYREYGHRLGLGFEQHPEMVALPSVGLLFALEYWKVKGLNAFADQDDILTITKRINGGTNGLADRKAKLAQLKSWMA